MKKLIALMFVCAGLTAMAAVPHVNNAKVVSGKADKSMVLKANTLSNQLSAPAMKMAADKNAMPIQKFFAEKKVTPADNKLMKKAPRRVTADDIMATKIAFLEGFEYNEDSAGLVEAVQHYTGGWEVEMEEAGDNVFNAYLYFTGIPFEITVDYSAETVEMTTGYLYGMQWSDTTKSGKTTTIEDTTEYIFLVDEAYMLSDDENADFSNLQGELYEDGTIFIPDGWLIYDLCYTVKRVIRSGNTTTTYDTVPSISNFFHNTYLMTSNATHSYTSHYSKDIVDEYVAAGYPASYFEPEDESVPVYMFQYNDTIAVAWNVFGMGQRGRAMYIYEDGTMEMPGDVAYEASNGRDYENISVGWDAVADTADWNNASYWTIGTVTPTKIAWGENCLYDFNSGYYLISYFGNNELTFTTDEYFMLGYTTTPVITYEVNDDNVVVTAAPGDEEEATVLLGIYDAETEMVTWVDNPYTIERTDADQTIIFAARALAYGKNVSEWAVAEITIPALEGPSFLRGDVDMDGSVGISDVSALIDYLLSHDDTDVSVLAADCDEDGSVGISDVSALIDYLLAHEWE